MLLPHIQSFFCKNNSALISKINCFIYATFFIFVVFKMSIFVSKVGIKN